MAGEKNKRAWRLALVACVLAALALGAVAVWRMLPIASVTSLGAASYSDADFDIETYVSAIDADGDGVDDQADILAGARAYVATHPRYGSAYYAGGWPTDGQGVCTDVVAQALLAAGYDLREEVYADRLTNPDGYEADENPDIDIDFRRVRNLRAYFSHTATSLSCDTSDIAAWQGGDIVVWGNHIGVVSNVRRADGIPYVIHHRGVLQLAYEEDVLLDMGQIVGHYRVS